MQLSEFTERHEESKQEGQELTSQAGISKPGETVPTVPSAENNALPQPFGGSKEDLKILLE